MDKTFKVIVAVCGIIVVGLATAIVCTLGLPKKGWDKIKEFRN